MIIRFSHLKMQRILVSWRFFVGLAT